MGIKKVAGNVLNFVKDHKWMIIGGTYVGLGAYILTKSVYTRGAIDACDLVKSLSAEINRQEQKEKNMRFKDIFLTSTISTFSVLTVLALYKWFLSSEEQSKDEAEDYILMAEDIKPETKAKLLDRLLDRFKPDRLKKAYISKKLLKEIVKRDISITIDLKKPHAEDSN